MSVNHTLLSFLEKNAQDITILYAEDEELLQKVTIRYFKKFCPNIDTASDGVEALALYEKKHHDLVITDLNMPNMDGMELVNRIKKIYRDQEIIVISAYSDQEQLMKAIALGVNGYILKPVDFDTLNNTLYNSIFKIKKIKENEQYRYRLLEMVQEKSHEVTRLLQDKIYNLQQSIFSFVELIEKRDSYTAGHSSRVANYSTLIARACGIKKKEIKLLNQAAMLHDIGKVTTPDVILLKPGKLDTSEFQLMKDHVNTGYEFLSSIPMYKKHANIMRYHHEKYDGTGYPDGLKGDEIPKLSMILAIADDFDAMTTSRIYQARKSISQSLKEIKMQSGIQFDVHTTRIAVEVLKNIDIPESVAQIPRSKLEEERYAYYFKDQLCHSIYNDKYFEFIIQQNIIIDPSFNQLFIFSIENFNAYRDQHGWDQSNALLVNIGKQFSSYNRGFTNFRIHEHLFVTILSETEVEFFFNYHQYFVQEELRPELDIKMKFVYFNVEEIHSIKDIEEILYI